MKHFKRIELLKILIVAVKTFFVLFFLCILLILFVQIFYSYERICFQLLSFYGKTEKLEIFKTLYLTPKRHEILKSIVVIAGCFLIFILFKLNKIALEVARHFFYFLRSLIFFIVDLTKDFRLLSGTLKWFTVAMLLLLGGLKYFFIDRYYFHIDEIFSYLFFVKKGFWVIVSYYPGPNNHILYSLLVYFLQPFFSDPYYLMKVPTLLLSLVASTVFFLFLLRYTNFHLALLCTFLFSCAPRFFYYSLFGRGYVLMTLFVVLSFFMVLKILEGNHKKYPWHMYTVFSIFGFYSMIIYVYPYISFSMAILAWGIYCKNWKFLKRFFYYNVLVFVSVLTLYTPLLLISGLSSLISNPWIIRLPWHEFIQNFPSLIEGIFGYILSLEQGAFWVGLLLLLSATFILIQKQQYSWLLLIASMFVSPLLVLLVQRVQPFDRVWTYLIFPLSLCLWQVLDFIFSSIRSALLKNIILLSLCAMTIVSAFFYFYEDTRYGHQIYDEVGRICKYVVKENSGEVFTNEDVYNIYLRYEASRAGRTLVPEMSMETADKQFSYVLLTPYSSFPVSLDRKRYMLKEQNEYIRVYKIKE